MPKTVKNTQISIRNIIITISLLVSVNYQAYAEANIGDGVDYKCVNGQIVRVSDDNFLTSSNGDYQIIIKRFKNKLAKQIETLDSLDPNSGKYRKVKDKVANLKRSIRDVKICSRSPARKLPGKAWLLVSENGEAPEEVQSVQFYERLIGKDGRTCFYDGIFDINGSIIDITVTDPFGDDCPEVGTQIQGAFSITEDENGLILTLDFTQDEAGGTLQIFRPAED